jgi:hypothetical protein
VLAANQTIGLPAGSEGNSLVFLATSTTTDTPAPDAGDLPDNQPAPSALGEAVSPYVAAPTEVTGQECDTYQAGQQDASGNPYCNPAPSGEITYAAGSGAPAELYYLTVPDWLDTTAHEMDAVTLPHIAGRGGLASRPAGIYAFSVPINPGAPVASVTLPDVGASVQAAPGVPWPALHIFGIAVASTTTATPGSTAARAAGPWTGAWASPAEGSFAPRAGENYRDQTFRIVTRVSAGGSALRLRLSDSLAAPGTAALSIGAVTVAQQKGTVGIAPPPEPVTFGGSGSVTIPEGADVYSDPVSFPVRAGEYLTVSIFLSGGTYPSLPEETWCSACTEYVSPAGSGNATTSISGQPFTGAGTVSGDFSTILTGVDVLGTGLPTVVVLGDQVIGGLSTGKPVHGARRVSDDLASALARQPGGPAFGVVSAGIESNEVLTDQDAGTGAAGGPSALSRLARDVIAEPGVGTVIIDEGTEDLLHGASEQELGAGYAELAGDLEAWGITVIFATLTPCYGYSPSAGACTAAVDVTTRQAVNSDLMGAGANPAAGCSATSTPPAMPPCTFTADFSSAAGTTTSPQRLIAADDAGDHVNLSDVGYSAEAGTIPVTAGKPTPLVADAPQDY